MLFVLWSVRSGDSLWLSIQFVTATFVFCSKADKVPVEGLAIKDKGKGNESESEKEKKHGDGPSPTTTSPTTTSPTTQSAAVTQ